MWACEERNLVNKPQVLDLAKELNSGSISRQKNNAVEILKYDADAFGRFRWSKIAPIVAYAIARFALTALYRKTQTTFVG